MKKFIFNTLAIILVLIVILPSTSKADDWKIANVGYFNTPQKVDVDYLDNSDPYGSFYYGDVIESSQATIAFAGKLFSFISYTSKEYDKHKYFPFNGYASQVKIRKISFDSFGSPNYANWKSEHLQAVANLGKDYLQLDHKKPQMGFQPAPVVFNNVLYLFVLDKDGCVAYSTYDAGADTWSKLIKTKFTNRRAGFMSAVSINGKLCLATSTAKEEYPVAFVVFHCTDNLSTEGLTNWTDFSGNWELADGTQISTIVKTSIEIQSGKTKMINSLIYGYISPGMAICRELRFDENNKLYLHDSQYFSNDGANSYKSITLAQGSLTDTCNTVQAFLQRNMMEDKSNRSGRRIVRYEQKGNNKKYVLAEKNMFPLKMWSDESFNLNAVNFAKTRGDSIIQYMCLLYRYGKDKNFYCGSLLTDYLIKDKKVLTLTLDDQNADIANTLYVGYIEGVPPYYLNTKNENYDIYHSPDGPISEVSFRKSKETSIGKDTLSRIGITSSVKIGGILNTSTSYALESAHKNGSTNTTEITQILSYHAQDTAKGFYITVHPTINRAKYTVHDVKGHPLYPVYYYYMSEPEADQEIVGGLKNGLNPSQPQTYMNRSFLDEYQHYQNIDKQKLSWADANSESSVEYKSTVENTSSNSTTNTIKLGVGSEEEHMWDIEFEGETSLEITTTSVSKTSNTIEVACRMNDAVSPTDMDELKYTPYWIVPTPGQKTWWFHEGQDTTQNTWCLTYRVNEYKFRGGSIIRELIPSPKELDDNQNNSQNFKSNGFNLYQNVPNPFKPVTKIRYQIGNDNSDGITNAEGSQTRLVIYNTSGMVVANLVNEWKAPGSYEVDWDASKMPPGIYFYSMQSGKFKDIKKLILLK